MNQENFYIADFIMNLPAGSLIFSSPFFILLVEIKLRLQ
jgi:hypothetical protein